MVKRTPFLLILSLLLAACNLPDQGAPVTPPPTTATADVVATEVARIQTEVPTATLPPATPTLAASATAIPSPTAVVLSNETTATPVAGDPAVSLGAASWQDPLDTTKNFYLYSNDNTTIEAGSGSLHLSGATNIGWHGWTLTYAQNVSDFYLEGLFKTGSCSGGDLYGLVFRASKEDSGYFFGATCDGRYNLYTRDFNSGANNEVLALKTNPAILTGSGQTNRLGVKTDGSNIALYANGVLLEEITNDTYSSGYFGPFIASYTSGFSVDLDQISLWKLD